MADRYEVGMASAGGILASRQIVIVPVSDYRETLKHDVETYWAGEVVCIEGEMWGT